MVSSKPTAAETIALGKADVLASRVSPRQTVARAVEASIAVDENAPASRSVVWSHTARDVYIAAIAALKDDDPTRARDIAGSIDRVAAALGHSPVGVDGRVPWTWEKAVPDLPYLLVFELVTWTKAGEVIAIDALLGERGDPALEKVLF